MNQPRSKKVSKVGDEKPKPSTVKDPEDIFGCLKGEIEIVGDVLLPLVPLEDWEALRES